MTALWALVADTWQQSRQQRVFTIMLILLAITAGMFVSLLKPAEDKEGKPSVAWIWDDASTTVLSRSWRHTYVQTMQLRDGSGPNPFDEDAHERTRLIANDEEMEKRVGEMARGLSPRQRSLEMWAFWAAATIFTISMLFFIAACAGYFPDLLAAGAVDLVVSKPIDRLRIFLGKYAGGLALYTVALLGTYSIIFVGLGLRFGYWPVRLFLCAPITIFSAALLYALLALIGITRRSSTLAIVLGYIFYLVVDSAIGLLVTFGQMGVFKNAHWVEVIYRSLQRGFPNFSLLKSAAAGSLLTLPSLDFMPVATATGWLIGSLALGYWLFRRQDF